ncbi:SRPBCC domain-containing protein [Nocardia brevicatena]|uniref:SRPBCC domain-containing protein n=1 Tax=Nocardia brevicatena TaxID=37327 RepID=UPI000304F2FD|nr:SRPBCC domain-containing protein [Nocardia brevicatena]
MTELDTAAVTITHPSDTETVVVRRFAGTAQQLFDLWTTPELVAQWWPSGGRMTANDIDLRIGGKWRWAVFNDEYNLEAAYSGEYRTVDSPVTLAFSEAFEALPGSGYENFITFDEHDDGTTTVTERMSYPTQELRDGHRASGFDAGISAAFERIDALLAGSQ